MSTEGWLYTQRSAIYKHIQGILANNESVFYCRLKKYIWSKSSRIHRVVEVLMASLVQLYVGSFSLDLSGPIQSFLLFLPSSPTHPLAIFILFLLSLSFLLPVSCLEFVLLGIPCSIWSQCWEQGPGWGTSHSAMRGREREDVLTKAWLQASETFHLLHCQGQFLLCSTLKDFVSLSLWAIRHNPLLQT